MMIILSKTYLCLGCGGVEQRSICGIISAVSAAPAGYSATTHESRLPVWQRCLNDVAF